jgi:hypothetical protein
MSTFERFQQNDRSDLKKKILTEERRDEVDERSRQRRFESDEIDNYDWAAVDRLHVARQSLMCRVELDFGSWGGGRGRLVGMIELDDDERLEVWSNYRGRWSIEQAV